MSIELETVCTCGAALGAVLTRDSSIEVDICESCYAQEYQRGYDKGYDEGYNESQEIHDVK